MRINVCWKTSWMTVAQIREIVTLTNVAIIKLANVTLTNDRVY